MNKKISFISRIGLSISVLALSMPLNLIGVANAASLTTGSVTLSDSRPSNASTTYTIQFSGVSLSPIKCIKAAFSDASTAGSKPSGMTITSLAFSGTSNYVPTPASWGVSNNNGTGVSSITFATGETPASASGRTVVLTAITNGSVAATTYFLQFSTYNNIDCSTSPVDSSTIAFIYVNGQTVSATVDPTLTFTVNGVAASQAVNGATTTRASTATSIHLATTDSATGTLSSATNAIAAQDLLIGTNAASGYTITIKYTGILASGANDINDWTGTNAAPTTFSAAGTEAFGYTTNDAVLGTGTAARFSSNKWAALTTSPLEVGYNAGAVSETIRVGFQAGISATTPAGAYGTTVIYVATPTY